jgi:hypothetical protein
VSVWVGLGTNFCLLYELFFYTNQIFLFCEFRLEKRRRRWSANDCRSVTTHVSWCGRRRAISSFFLTLLFMYTWNIQVADSRASSRYSGASRQCNRAMRRLNSCNNVIGTPLTLRESASHAQPYHIFSPCVEVRFFYLLCSIFNMSCFSCSSLFSLFVPSFGLAYPY